jgi:predicted nucleotidyltransferase
LRERQTRIVSIAGLVILKFIAWSERHRTAPGKDAYDLQLILTHYLDAGNLQRLYESHADLIDADFDYPLVSARLAGRDASALLHRHGDQSQTVRKKLHGILETQVDPAGPRVLIGQSSAVDAERFRMQLVAFQRGLAE